jgi:hypothetical protein
VLAALRTELIACGVAAVSMNLTRLQGSLTLTGDSVVGYFSGWLLWPTGRLSRRGQPVYAVHPAGDPSGAARRLALLRTRDG